MLNAQVVATNKPSFDTVMALNSKAFERIEQFHALTLQATSRGPDQVKKAGVAGWSACDAQSLWGLRAGLLQPAEQAAAVQAAFSTLIEAGSKNVRSSSSHDVLLIKSTMATANSAIESLRKAGLQSVETAEANYASVTK